VESASTLAGLGLVLGLGAVLARANAASNAVDKRGPGHRAPCLVTSRQARHTRSPWVSSHESGGAAPIGGGTPTTLGRPSQSVRPPRGVRTAALAEPHSRWSSGGVVRGRGRGVLGWDGSRACTSDEGSSIFMGPVAAGGDSRECTCVSSCTGSGSVSIGAPAGARGASPVHPCTSPCTGPGSVAGCAWGVPWGGALRGRGKSRLGSVLRIRPRFQSCWGVRT